MAVASFAVVWVGGGLVSGGVVVFSASYTDGQGSIPVSNSPREVR